jgi:transcriptional regulator with XRE-family HTH domain
MFPGHAENVRIGQGVEQVPSVRLWSGPAWRCTALPVRLRYDRNLSGINLSIEIYQMRNITSRQLKAALAMLGWKVSDLAAASGVSEPTIWRLETSDGALTGRDTTIEKLIGALEGAGVIFLDENGEGPGVRLRKTSKQRSSKPAPPQKTRPRRS